MPAPDNREEIKDLIHRGTDKFRNGANAAAYRATVFPGQIRAVLNQAEQAMLAAAQRTKEALELMSLGSKSFPQISHPQSRCAPKFKIVER